VRTLLAITRDTLQLLCRRRLFWLHLWMNLGVVLLYASVGFQENGWSAGFGLKITENAWVKAGSPWEHSMHCWMIARLMLWWVAGGGVFLALFATAPVLPESLEPGAAALLVPRARRRSLIMAGRFLGSLGYMLLHTVLVVAGLWVAVHVGMGTWHHTLWLAVPLAVLLYIPLQAVAMFMGVLTRSATAALLVAILFAGSVWAIQESAAGPDPDSSSAAEEENAEPQGSGFSEALTHEAVQQAAAVLPRTRDSVLWLEREVCPQPQPAYGYRALFRRLRIGQGGISAVAADAIASASAVPEKKPDHRLTIAPLLASSAAFTTAVLALGAWILKRRDL